jgi:hypothetical protein
MNIDNCIYTKIITKLGNLFDEYKKSKDENKKQLIVKDINRLGEELERRTEHD